MRSIMFGVNTPPASRTGRQPASAARAGAPCDQFGLEQGRAVARLFGIAQLPLLVGADGMGHVGVPATLASVGTGERR